MTANFACDIDGLGQDYSNSSANALELLQSFHEAIDMTVVVSQHVQKFVVIWWIVMDYTRMNISSKSDC